MESFIENQLTYATRFESLALCHRRLKSAGEASRRVSSIEEFLHPIARSIDRIAYDNARYLPWLTVRAAQEYITKIDPRVIHVHYLVDAAFYAPLLRDIRVPVVVSGYGYDVSRFPHQAFGLGKLYLTRGFDPPNIFLAMSEAMKRDFVALGIPEDFIRVHYHGIDIARFTNPEREYAATDSIRILTSGRLVSRKGHAVLLQAVRALLDRNGLSHKLNVWILGDGPLRADLEKLVAELDLKSVVRFKGHVPYESEGYLAQYRQADIFALPCHDADGTKEGIPGTLIEAMASGLPVVSTVYAGIPEVVRHSVDGLLVGEGSVQELADALSALIAHPDLRSSLGRAAAHRALEFDVRKRTAELEKIYASLTGEEEKPKSRGNAPKGD